MSRRGCVTVPRQREEAPLPKKYVSTSQAPKPIGPYSQGVISGGLLFASGQIAMDPATGQLVEGDVAVQTERVLTNLLAILKDAKMGPERVVKATQSQLVTEHVYPTREILPKTMPYQNLPSECAGNVLLNVAERPGVR